METKSEKEIKELQNNFCKDAYYIMKEMFEQNPGKKMVLSEPIGYRKITQIAPFGSYTAYKETKEGKWEPYDSHQGQGHLMALEHYIHGEIWCDKALDAWYGCVQFWNELLNILYQNDIRKQVNQEMKEGKKPYVTFEWVDNDMSEEHWTLSC